MFCHCGDHALDAHLPGVPHRQQAHRPRPPWLILSSPRTCALQEDSLRIYTLWDFQHGFVTANSGLPENFSKLFLVISFTIQISAALLVVPIRYAP